MEDYPGIQVTALKGEAFVHIHTGLSQRLLSGKDRIIENVASIAIGLGGAERVHVNFTNPI
jgi:hypothetical protein